MAKPIELADEEANAVGERARKRATARRFEQAIGRGATRKVYGWVAVAAVVWGAFAGLVWLMAEVRHETRGIPDEMAAANDRRWAAICESRSEALQKDWDQRQIADAMMFADLLNDEGCDPRLAAGYVASAKRQAERCGRAEIAMHLAFAEGDPHAFHAAATWVYEGVCPRLEWWSDAVPEGRSALRSGAAP